MFQSSPYQHQPTIRVSMVWTHMVLGITEYRPLPPSGDVHLPAAQPRPPPPPTTFACFRLPVAIPGHVQVQSHRQPLFVQYLNPNRLLASIRKFRAALTHTGSLPIVPSGVPALFSATLCCCIHIYCMTLAASTGNNRPFDGSRMPSV